MRIHIIPAALVAGMLSSTAWAGWTQMSLM